jgi:hypothetical protein
MEAMANEPAGTLVLERRIERAELVRLARLFGDMIKFVVDVERGVIAIGGELHADAEQPSSRRAVVRPTSGEPTTTQDGGGTDVSSSRRSSTSGPPRGTPAWRCRTRRCGSGSAR